MRELYTLLATIIVVIHAVWILWMAAGIFVARTHRVWRELYLASVLLTLGIMATIGICPLTDLEMYLDHLAGKPAYTGGFIRHYADAFVYGQLIPITNQGLFVLTMLIAALGIWVTMRRKWIL